SLGIVAGERIPDEASPAEIPQRHVALERMLPKFASGMNKPAQQTIITSAPVKKLLETSLAKKMKQLGGKLGSSLQMDLRVNTDF
ncbi:hypothetical protein Tco_0584051, partial [Tanacetum coccineum]